MKVNILIVDDKQANLETLEFMIRDIDFEDNTEINVIKTNNGNNALNLAMKNDISLIILDIQMPQMDGFEVARYLKKSSKTKDIPIAFLTAAYKSEEMREYGLHIGAFDYFLKPIDPLILVPKIKLYVNFYVITNELKNTNKTLKQKVKEAVEENQQKEQMLFQQSKMASMGEMIGNIAHQWRQPLSVISMSVNNIAALIELEEELSNDDLLNCTNNVAKQCKHLSHTINDFRNFFAPNKEKNNFRLKSIIDKTMNLLSASFKTHDIQVIENIEDIEITTSENELTQAILNIIKNAKRYITHIICRYQKTNLYKYL